MSVVANDDAISELRSGHVGDIYLIQFTAEAEAEIFEHAYDFMAVHRQNPVLQCDGQHRIQFGQHVPSLDNRSDNTGSAK